MRPRTLSARASLLALALATSLPGSALAQSIFIPVDFGASYEPKQLNEQLTNAAIEDGRFGMLPGIDRDGVLGARFPELTLPKVSDLEQEFSTGSEAYFNGDYAGAANKLSEALDSAAERVIALTMRSGFADTVFQGGLYLIQIYAFVKGEPAEAEKVMDRLISTFPTQVPGEDQFPPDLVELYKTHLPTAANGHSLTVRVAPGCNARLNGKDLEPGEATLLVKTGTYGLAEVCEEQTKRAFIVPIAAATIIDFHGEFATRYTFPASNLLDGKGLGEDPTVLISMLAELGRRIGVSHIVAAGLVSGEGGDDYRMLLVDVPNEVLVREFTLRTVDIATPDGMADAVNALWTGDDFSVIKPPSEGITWTTVGIVGAGLGGAVLAGGGWFGYMAQTAHDDFLACNKVQECRVGAEDEKHLSDRRTNAIIADSLFGLGAALTITGGVLILLDRMDMIGGGSETEEANATPWMLGVAPTSDGGVVGFFTRW